ncbi:MAG: hypothetical protein KDA25_06640 [Phycisphaerales bacterium]|nr:hypothetical protein [Phycisphaerales bacterium]
MTPDPHAATSPELSAAGAARRERMLEDILGDMVARHRRRRVRRRAIGAAMVVIALAVVVAPLVRTPPAPMSTPSPSLARQADASVRIRIVQSDPDVVARLAAPSSPGLVRRIDDDELVRTLVEVHRPAGLIRVGTEVRLSAAVTGVDLIQPAPPPPA